MALVNVLGILASGFIVACNLLDWAKSRSLTTCDLILVVFGISSISFECTQLGNIYISELSQGIYDVDAMNPFIYLFLLCTCLTSCWVTACLCVFYCVKIVDINHRLFYWIKLRISKNMPWVLLVIIIGSLTFSVAIDLDLYGESYWNSSANLTANATLISGEMTLKLSYILANVFGFCLPLLLEIASIILILTSLYRHARRMKENASAFSQPRLDAHVGAAKMVGSLLLIFASFLVAECVALTLGKDWANFVLGTFVTFFIPAQTIILIQRTNKLKHKLWKVLTSWRQ
ncbi:taste receptor type 2 member 7-like [Lissotriton helveticus]